MLEVAGLRKSFGTRPALAGVDLRLEAGGTMVLLGPNGAGKTTLVRILATLLRPDSGTVTVAGFDAVREPVAVRRAIGFSGQAAAVDDYLTVRENLLLAARLHGLDPRRARHRAGELLDLFALGDAAGRQPRRLSGGLRRRLHVALGLVSRPRLLILDEPTAGLDPRSREQLWGLIAELVATGTTLLMTTQQMEEIERIATTVAVLGEGRVIAADSAAALRRRVGGEEVEVVAPSPAGLEAALDALGPLLGARAGVDRAGRRLRFPAGEGTETLALALRRLDEAGVGVEEIGLRRPSLNDVFLALTGRGVDDGGAAPVRARSLGARP
jgi:ABC-2 type transport system ATP-binding protein